MKEKMNTPFPGLLDFSFDARNVSESEKDLSTLIKKIRGTENYQTRQAANAGPFKKHPKK